ncbi:2-succinyl-5-enolpyruvyl-6-hydroxy-3-cyclohexene-1-carboxylic-acid synthase [Rudanella lutea]|uniref:2-succinyl-5-enolpyruvyl-6-hydroxy-3- cyclohexene-1-carboxylic-acid synthase n=1 Tax=Rudanella lutea TaxID=451374 RepID=UPI00036927C8|nr:2-succinyl-5-enolpyruvyl-6-hydroxy-3-cyclohexene-1-carboxylic-acid synthase [Rudanella lutea]
MPVLQPIVNIAELIYRKGITDVVISPGSRSAPLTIAVARHPGLRTRVVADERSAGFVALGMAMQSGRPVAVICTSGSAVYNLAPAVAEAYFAEVPLLLLTADRPHEWLYQQDGQTMVQAGVFGPHVKRSFDLPADYTHADSRWFIERSVNEAVNLSRLAPAGPVHINVPLREPFYPAPGDELRFESVRLIETLATTAQLPADVWHRLLDEWDETDRKLIAVGQMPYNPALLAVLHKISEELGVPVVGELPGNIGQNGLFITRTDTFLSGADEALLDSLRPDLLITIGGSFLTRNLKTYFRQYPARVRHWHIGPDAGRISDPFRSLTTLVPMEPLPFLEKLFADIDYQRFRQGDDDSDESFAFRESWQQADRRAARVVAQSLARSAFTDWTATQALMDALPQGSVLHLANSMPVRYANLCGLPADRQVAVCANRGVSGIDGCLSTAVGAALQTDQIVTVLIGDVAFFYDRNALWHAQLPPNLRIVLLNNHAGHIFRMIDGPSRQPELDEFFETEQPLTAARTAEDAQISYHFADDAVGLKQAFDRFFEPSETARLLEVRTDKQVNEQEFKRYKERLREG